MAAVSNISTPMQSVNQGSIISVRTSDARFQSVSSGGLGYVHPSTINTKVYYQSLNHAGRWNQIVTPISAATGKTVSFSVIHAEVESAIGSSVRPSKRAIGFPTQGGEGYVPPTGQTDPAFASPVGDALLPMLMIVTIYALKRLSAILKRTLLTSNR